MAMDIEKCKVFEYMGKDSSFNSEKNSSKLKVIPHCYEDLKRRAKNQIHHYLNQILYHPDRKSAYLKYINEIIIDEQTQGRGIKSRCLK